MTDRGDVAVFGPGPGDGPEAGRASSSGRHPYPRPPAARAASGRPANRGGEGPTAAVQEVLDGLPGSVTFLVPETGPDGRVADFRIAAASPDAVDVAGRRGRELVGLRILEAYPGVAGSELWQGYLDALATGVRYESEPFEYAEESEGVPRLSRFAVRAAPSSQGLTVSWVRLDSGERDRRRLTAMQRLAQLGWADWDLTRNETIWSEQVYTIFGRSRPLGPIALPDLPRHALPEDAPALDRAVRGLLGTGEAVDHAFRLTTPDGRLRHVRLVAEGETDGHGTPVEVHGFFQDRTAVAHAEQQLLEHERAALVQRSQLAAERELAADLQHALLPLPEQSLRLAGLTVDIAYHPLQAGLNVGGDWYSAIELPDGSALLVIGDVAGHGLGAVATMAQLRFTAKGMAVTGSSLPTILARLNTLLLHSSDRNFGTATIIMARYHPATSTLDWVQAGHPPPLLLRDGTPRYLPAPGGILLGATTSPDYVQSTLRLLPGDHLLLYTDGLIESPGESLDKGLDRLARVATESVGRERFLDGVQEALVAPQQRRDDICVLHVAR
ncbi:PP2C family protein-serine/threonine phosphatase [Kitasatospora sp. NPDC059646]|uniref:PP2C family protein-serine/threonine phosphatase n=1 Tax=Kitasatospora sp. NPDC059646 TaxID=3346893 RepID=UPI00368B09CD